MPIDEARGGTPDLFLVEDIQASGHIFIAGAGAKLNFGGASTRRVPIPSEQAPFDFVDRPEITRPLLAYLLSDEPAPNGRAVISAVHGLGGLGKTTIARWIIWRPEIEQRFPDGRIWVSIGSEPSDAIAIVSDCVRQFDPTMQAKATVEMASAEFSALLRDRSVLIVIDDVWPGKSAEVAKSLLVPSLRSRFVLTTRFPQLAADAEIRAREFPLDEMSVAQAQDLIARSFARELNSDELGFAAQLCTTVGGHPLALELGAARVREGRRWKALLADLTHEIARLEALEPPVNEIINAGLFTEVRKRRTSVRASLLLSIRYLNRPAQRLFALFGVLSEDASITASLASTLWSVDEATAESHLRTFSGLGILSVKVGFGFNLHDLMHDIARELLSKSEDVEQQSDNISKLTGATQQFLHRYRAKAANKLWHTLPDDGYFHDHLIRHFEQVGWDDEIEALLWEESADGRCGWYQARERLGQTAGFIGDVTQIWSYADGLTTSGSKLARSKAVALQLHCALIISSINSLSAGIPIETLVGAVRCEVLSLASALALARQHPKRQVRLDIILALDAGIQWSFQTGLVHEALNVARGIADAETRAESLVKIVQQMPMDERASVLEEALDAGRGIEDARARAELLARIVQRLPVTERRRVLEESVRVARGLENLASRAVTLAQITRHLPIESCAGPLNEAFMVVRSIEEDADYEDKDYTVNFIIEALIDVALRLPRAQALEVARALEGKERGNVQMPPDINALINVAQRLAEEFFISDGDLKDIHSYAVAVPEVRESLTSNWQNFQLDEELKAARRIEDPHASAKSMAEIAQRLTAKEQPAVLREALAIVFRSIGDRRQRAKTLDKLDGFVATYELSKIEKAIDFSVHIWYSVYSTGSLPLAIVQRSSWRHEPTELLQELAAARDVIDPEARASELAEIAIWLPPNERTSLLCEASNAARDITEPGRRAVALSEIAQRALIEQRHQYLFEALSLALTIEDDWSRSWTLEQIASGFNAQASQRCNPEWTNATHTLATRTRQDCLEDLSIIIPFIWALGGGDTLQLIKGSITTISKWWP